MQPISIEGSQLDASSEPGFILGRWGLTRSVRDSSYLYSHSQFSLLWAQALLGDIGYARDEQEYLGFLRTQLQNFRFVFLVLGNHAPWHRTWKSTRAMFHRFGQSIPEQRKQGASLGEFVLLDKTRFDIDIDGPGDQGTTILGCTLSSRVPDSSLEAVGLGINDFYYIDDWTVEQHTARFEEELEWLNSEIGKLQNTGRKVVVLTHYCPTSDQRATNPRRKSSPIQPDFATELRDEPCFASGLVKLWAFGHTRYNCDFIDKQTGVRGGLGESKRNVFQTS